MPGKTVRNRKALIIVAFILLILSVRVETSEIAQENREEFLQEYPFSPQGCFELKNINGQIQVTTWSQPEVEIRAIKKTKRDPKNLKLVRIEINSLGQRMVVKTIYPKLKNVGVTVDYSLRLPEKLAQASLKVINGQIQISGNLGQVKASTVNGPIHTEGLAELLSLKTVNGEIEAIITSGSARMETVNGSIVCYLRDLKDDLTLETVNGSIKIKMESESLLNGYLEAKSTNGVINVDLPLALRRLVQSRGHFEAQIGVGGPQIRIRTVNGSISLTH